MNNNICINGTVLKEPIYSHSCGIEDYYQFPIITYRLSGTPDIINVVAPESVICDFQGPQNVLGQIRERTYYNETGKHKCLYVLAESIVQTTEHDRCDCELAGTICKRLPARTTPAGRVIVDFIIKVPTSAKKACYLPCIAWEHTALAISQLPENADVIVSGRLQSRNYTKESKEYTVNEISVFQVSLQNC